MESLVTKKIFLLYVFPCVVTSISGKYIPPKKLQNTDEHKLSFDITPYKHIYSNESILYRYKKLYPFSKPHHPHHLFHKSQNFSSVHDLNHVMQTFLDKRNCLAVIDNWQSVNFNLQFLQHPLLIRYPEPAMLSLPTGKGKEQSIWISRAANVTSEYVSINLNSTLTKTRIYCPVSNLYITLHTSLSRYIKHQDICVRLNVLKFLAHSKPWNCEILVSIHPSIYLADHGLGRNELTYPNVFGYPVELDTKANKISLSLPSEVPMIYLIVSQIAVSQLQHGALIACMSGLLYKKLGPFLSYDIFMWLPVTPFGRADSLSVFRMLSISDTRNFLLTDHASTDFGLTNNLTFKSIQDYAYVAKNEPIGLYVEHTDDDQSFGAVKHHLSICKNHVTHWPRKLVGIPYASFSDRVGHAYAHLWQSVLINFTYYSMTGPVCVDWKSNDTLRFGFRGDLILDLKLHTNEHPTYYPVSYTDKINNLRFVACGKLGVAAFPFLELLAAFDVYSWIWVLFVLVGMMKFHLSSFSDRYVDKCKIVLHYLVLFLEQGTSVTRQVQNKTAYRVVFGLTIIMAVVLSNAYKNTNVLNMITSRNLLLYTELKELIKENFTVILTHLEMYFIFT